MSDPPTRTQVPLSPKRRGPSRPAITLAVLAALLALVIVMSCLKALTLRGGPEPAARPPVQQPAPPPPAGGAEMSVAWDEAHQTIVGFGGTMGWIHPNPKQFDEVFDLLFTRLGATILRVHALGGEEGDEDCLEPVNDDAYPYTFNWAGFPIARTEAKNAAIIKAAEQRGVPVIIPTAWSPPGWMKDSERRGGWGSLNASALEEYAELWAAYVIGMRREFNIETRRLSIQNEPDITYYYPTCRIPAPLYAQALAAVADRFRRENLRVELLGPDTCRIYNAEPYVQAMNEAGVSPGTPILTHLYDLAVDYADVARDPPRWIAAREMAEKHGRPLWLMETANYLSTDVAPGSYDEALIWAEKVHWALVEGDCQVVCYWALFFDKEGESLIYCPASGSRDYTITPKYYTSMNYYRFVRSGMIRCSASCDDTALLVSAFRSPAGEKDRRVLVVVNPGNQSRSAALPADPEGPWTRHQTTEKDHCAPVDLSGRRVAFPPRSVTTLVWEGP